MSAPLIFVRDGRTLPFVPVTTAALDAIRAGVPAKRLAPARSLYLALLELANEGRGDRVASSRKALGEHAGMSRDLVTDLGPLLQAAGVVEIVAQHHGGQRLENEWIVVEPDERTPRPTATTPVAVSVEGGGPEPQLPNVEKREDLEPPSDPPVSFRGKRVPVATTRAALRAVEGWAARTSQTIRQFDGQGKPTDSLKRVVGAMLSFPEVVELWPKMIECALARPWWEGTAPGVGVVFGPGVVERMIEEAKRGPGGAGAPVGAGGPRRGGPSAEDFAQLAGLES